MTALSHGLVRVLQHGRDLDAQNHTLQPGWSFTTRAGRTLADLPVVTRITSVENRSRVQPSATRRSTTTVLGWLKRSTGM